jgi:hypothetical protein
MLLSSDKAALQHEPDQPWDEVSEAAVPNRSDEDVNGPKATVLDAPAGATVDVARLSRKELRAIKRQMIDASMGEYDGPCPCPYNTMRNGKECGGHSAHSRPGGESPLCFQADITTDMVREFLERHQ